MYLTESFSSNNIKKLFKNKDNFNIFKEHILNKSHISWDSISDDDVHVCSVREAVQEYIKTNDFVDIYQFVLPIHSKQALTIYTKDDNAIDSIYNQHNIGMYNTKYGGIIDSFEGHADIINDSYYSFYTKNNYVSRVEDIRNYLYISGDKVDVLRTLYKMLLLSAYSLKWHHMCPIPEAGDMLLDNFWRNQHGSEIIYYILYTIKDEYNTLSIENGKYKTKFTIGTTKKDYHFDFEIRGLSDDEFYERVNEYVEYLYEIDVDRKIKKVYFNDYPKYMFLLARKQRYVFEKNEYDDTIYDGYIPLFNFASVMFLFDCDVKSNKTYQYILADIMKYLVNNDTDIYRYVIQPKNEHVRNYSNKIRKRQLNKVKSIDVDETIDDESYVLAKEMMKYLWEFKDDIRKFAKRVDDEDCNGKYILLTYNNLLIIDNIIIKMSDVYSPMLKSILNKQPDFVKRQYEILKDNVEKFIDIVGNMVAENKILIDELAEIYESIREQYNELVGIYDDNDFDE